MEVQVLFSAHDNLYTIWYKNYHIVDMDLKGGAATAASQGSENFSAEKYRRPSPLLGTNLKSLICVFLWGIWRHKPDKLGLLLDLDSGGLLR